ncbi:spore protein [Romboutsia ilealis]|uniref:Spore protein n=1 Tax=Romboutsia faecis TaxID=2764597 RepID=A0ABR7JN41_9FIRM|nr:CD1290 family small acid-soluble spore protein [Romboutsia faecis]MBC5996128.1 spore protein [Romboutsia faecis]MRN23328.1 spore protein [Romboutsia ilealis]
MDYNVKNKNARIALKQVKFEIAADYGMNHEDVFDIIENAKSNGVLSNYFINLENKRDLERNICNNLNQTITTHLE